MQNRSGGQLNLLQMLRSIANRLERLVMGRKAYKWVLRDWQQLHDLPAAARLLETMRFSRAIEPQLMIRPNGQRLLVLAPHPDDEVIGPGGTLLHAVDAGAETKVIYVTSGTPDELPAREHEAEAVCRDLGCSHEFLRQEIFDIPIETTADAIRSAIDDFAPDTLFLPFVLDDNDDHRRLNHALLSLAITETVKFRPEVWAYQVYTPLPGNVAVDVTDVISTKASAIRRYGTQLKRRDWAHFALGLNAFNCRLVHGVSQSCYFEVFFVVPWTEYIDFCRSYFSAGGTYYEANYLG